MSHSVIRRGELRQLIEELKKQAAPYPEESFMDRLKACEMEFDYMCSYMQKGYKDDHRAEVFGQLAARILNIEYDIRVKTDVRNHKFLQGLHKLLASKDISAEALQAALLMECDAKTHLEALSTAFVALLTSYHWTHQQVEEWAPYLESSRTSQIDAATLVGAITLSTIMTFSYHKTMCLIRIYRNSSDVVVRQRALVGVFLAIGRANEDCKEELERCMDALLEADKDAASALIQTQLQLLSCANVDNDMQEIRQNIMPDLLRNQPFEITAEGIKEKEEESDCIDTGADERRMEAMEKSVKRMLNMQKSGADIFFHGFMQMKRFPFFYKMVNWFMPFTEEHPDMDSYRAGIPENNFVDKVLNHGPFCDSDKYSFFIGISSVINKMPDNVREALNSGEVGPIGMGDGKTRQDDPSFVRLRYLQDLLRYYRLCTFATETYNPFERAKDYASWINVRTHFSDQDLRDMCTHLLKTHDKAVVKNTVPLLLDAFNDKESLAYYYAKAEYLMAVQQTAEAMECYSKCLTLKKNHVASMRGYAKTAYMEKQYQTAAFFYDALATLYPDRKSYTINYCMAMVMDGKVEEVLNSLYKMQYESPDDDSINNVLGWALLYAGKAQQACEVYQKMTSKELGVAINKSYALLFTGRMEEAVEALATFTIDEIETNVMADTPLFEINGFGLAEQSIFLSFVYDKRKARG